MATAKPNYFTCTLGQATQLRAQNVDHVKGFETVIQLIDQQADNLPESPALAFANFAPASCNDVITFRRLCNLSVSASQILASCIGSTGANKPATTTAGLLCTSSVDFVLAWLGLMRLGYAVLLLAPQLEPNAITHLCKVLQVDLIIVDGKHYGKAEQVNFPGSPKALRIPSFSSIAPQETPRFHQEANELSDTALIFHTSGTSSGLPKPISLSHHAAVGSLPRFHDGSPPATFSTTPLYHGGLADCLRSWTSGAMVWCFPEGVVPITAANLLSAIGYARESHAVPVKYFSSVPYVLQMLAENEQGVQILRTMDLVGVGGAALPAKVGDSLVDAGINLLSRMGSAECGFLMSSHRDYDKEKDWQYLEAINDVSFLEFEARENGLFELIVKPNWPVRAKTNRDDGSYATSDLFEPHPSKPNAWRYHSRADAQITLSNGKKFDPSPMEGSILTSTNLLQDVFVFGNDRVFPGVLVFPRTGPLSDQELIDALWPSIDAINTATQGHARVARGMIVVVHVPEGQACLRKSNKGTILRRQAEEAYACEIELAYDIKGSPTSSSDLAPDEELLRTALDCFKQVLGREIDLKTDLYHQGVDSIASIHIRKLIESRCLLRGTRDLPMNIIYDKGTVMGLVEYLRRVRCGTDAASAMDQESQLDAMYSLARSHSDFHGSFWMKSELNAHTVVLTGATGFLGAHILHLLTRNSQVRRVYCLVRAKTPGAARTRVSEALVKQGLYSVKEMDDHLKSNRVVCLPCDVTREDLALSTSDRDRILAETNTFIHCAWTVNFNLQLPSFEDQVAGTRNLLQTAIDAGARFCFVSSTAAVSSTATDLIPEAISENPSDASPLGYSRSKWVAERVCVAAKKHISEPLTADPQCSQPISVIRIGQLCGNSAGRWNASEAYPLILSTAGFVDCLPDLPHEVLSWIPVELAAQAVIDIVSPKSHSCNESSKRRTEQGHSDLPVYHVLNPHAEPTWKAMLQWISHATGVGSFEIVPASEWIARLEAAFQNNGVSHPSHALLGVWKKQLCPDEDDESLDTEETRRPVFDICRAGEVSQTMREIEPLDRERVLRIWKWVQENIMVDRAG